MGNLEAVGDFCAVAADADTGAPIEFIGAVLFTGETSSFVEAVFLSLGGAAAGLG